MVDSTSTRAVMEVSSPVVLGNSMHVKPDFTERTIRFFKTPIWGRTEGCVSIGFRRS